MSVAPYAKIHQLQQAVLHEINELNQPQQGIMEMEIDVSLPFNTIGPIHPVVYPPFDRYG
jgi:hypothetical protein